LKAKQDFQRNSFNDFSPGKSSLQSFTKMAILFWANSQNFFNSLQRNLSNIAQNNYDISSQFSWRRRIK